jgi:hypothetical protein
MKDRLVEAVTRGELYRQSWLASQGLLVRALSHSSELEVTGAEPFGIVAGKEEWRFTRTALLSWEERIGERFLFLHPELQHADGGADGRKPSADDERLAIFIEVLANLSDQEPDLDPKKLPTGYKARIEALCHEKNPHRFSKGKNGTFYKFWKTDARRNVCRLADEDKYRS